MTTKTKPGLGSMPQVNCLWALLHVFCATDFPPPVTAQCALFTISDSNIVTVNCTTSEVPPDTVIEFSTCEVDGLSLSSLCKPRTVKLWNRSAYHSIIFFSGVFPSFSIDTSNFQPGQHRLTLALLVGDREIQVCSLILAYNLYELKLFSWVADTRSVLWRFSSIQK